MPAFSPVNVYQMFGSPNHRLGVDMAKRFDAALVGGI